MPSEGLSPETKLSVELDAICTRNRYSNDPERVLVELRAAAGPRVDVLTESVGTWVGYFEDERNRALTSALREIPGLEPWIEVGLSRRAAPHHGTPPLRS